MAVEDKVGDMLLQKVSNLPGFKVNRNTFLMDVLNKKGYNKDDINDLHPFSWTDIIKLLLGMSSVFYRAHSF